MALDPSARRRLAGVLAACALSAAGAVVSTPHASASHRSRPAATHTSGCGESRTAGRYRHVVWIVMENQGYAQATDAAAAPYLARLAQACGLATNYVALAHPSLPNYISLTAGSTEGIADDGEPAAHPLEVANLFGQLHGDWRALEESMPHACDTVTSGEYAARHNPAVYFTNLRAECRRDDIPLGLPLQLSSAFTFITPNVCDDMHSCPVSTGDRWLSRIVPLITASRAYRAGAMVLFITFDESDTGPGNHVATYVVAPSVRPGTRSAARFDAYSLLRTTEQLLHLPLLGGARRARPMVRAFNL